MILSITCLRKLGRAFVQQEAERDPASYSFVLRGYVHHWLDNVWAEYDRAGLIDIVEAKEPPRPTGWRLQPAGVPMSIEPPRGTGRK